MASNKPLRTALIGLSSSAATSWASSAHLPGLLTPTGRSKLPITALLNSSVKAAQSAIETYKLPPETKAYGSPEDLANDPDVDLVICNTRVDKHFETILPSVKKGKDVFVEWPVAATQADIQTLVQEAKKSGSRVAVGLQRRWGPQAAKLREIIKEGVNGKKLGKLLAVESRLYGGTIDREILPTGLKYFADRKVGGNVIVIGNAHALDTLLSVVGGLDYESVHSKLQLQRPNIRIRDPKTNEIVETIRSDVPDLLTFHGTLQSSSATLSWVFRRGQPFPGTPALTWDIIFEHGEIRFASVPGVTLEPSTIHVHWFDSDEVEEVKWEWSAEQAELPLPARSIISNLLALADDEAAGDGWTSLDEAANFSRLFEGFFAEWDKSQK